MIIINLPGGGVGQIDEAELFWLRKAFDGECTGATMLQLAADRLYSNEPTDALCDKFGAAKAPLAAFSAPEGRMKLFVSAHRVRQVIESDPVIYDEKARSLLLFPGRMRLAVRETPEEARGKLGNAGGGVA